jgi:hypothetical protein
MTGRSEEVTGYKVAVDDSFDAYSVSEFCRRHSISVPLFYKLKSQGKAPVTFYAGVRQLVSKESAAAWRREREKEAAI